MKQNETLFQGIMELAEEFATARATLWGAPLWVGYLWAFTFGFITLGLWLLYSLISLTVLGFALMYSLEIEKTKGLEKSMEFYEEFAQKWTRPWVKFTHFMGVPDMTQG